MFHAGATGWIARHRARGDDGGVATFYDLLGVSPDADVDAVKDAYRSLARALHPDTSGDAAPDAQRAMALLNEAWTTLSDPDRRADYDRIERVVPVFAAPAAGSPPTRPAPGPDRWDPSVFAPAPRPRASRKDEWIGGVRHQVVRLAAEAGRSASLTLSMRRRGRPREVYEACLPGVVEHLGLDTETRVRRARALGVAPLDLWLVTALIGVRSLVAALAREVSLGVKADETVLATAEMLDRMWDTIGHEVRHDVASGLGGNPHLHRWLTGHDH